MDGYDAVPVETTGAHVRVRREGGVAWVTLDRPPLNVFDIALLGELESALVTLQADDLLRLIVLEGAGKVFSAGVDIGEHLGDMLGPMLDAFTRAAMSVLEGAPALVFLSGNTFAEFLFEIEKFFTFCLQHFGNRNARPSCYYLCDVLAIYFFF